KRAATKARNKELGGNLDRAVQLYLSAEQPDEAARVILLKADGSPNPQERMVLCAQAARIGEGTDHGRQARERQAMLAFDLVQTTKGATMHGELLRVAADLEAVGKWEAAAEAYVMAGDTEAEIRVLKEAGAIERLEERLRETSDEARSQRDRAQLIRRIRDLDAIAERRTALQSAHQWLAEQPDDQLQLEVDRIVGRLICGPRITLEVDGERSCYVLGSTITIGRAGADVTVHSSAVSRQHLRLSRVAGKAQVEDLDTRNGTTLAGARIRDALPVGSGVELELAGQVAVSVAPASAEQPDGPVTVAVAGERYVLPLGPLLIGPWRVVDAHEGDERFVVLRTPEHQEPPHMAGYRLAYEIELGRGDRLAASRGGPVVLAVPEAQEN
ncbi:MAG: FHA domain-containing protein, partial [Deltaproteobacteria bacterium]|nr:FHA domain-containing protein [Deltaproteobacteria bacterium]